MPRVSEGSRGGPAACPLPPGSLPHSPLPRRRGLGSRASAATAAAERLRVGPARASGPPGPWPCPRPLAAVPEPGSAPRPGLNRFRGFRARQQPRPRAPARAMGRLRGARGRLPPGGLRAPPGRRTEGAFPGAGSGARATVRSASGRCARFGPVALCPPGCCAGAGRPCRAAPFLAEHPGPALRSGIGGPRPFARSLGLVSRPPAGRGARNRAGSARNWPPVGDICIARPRPTRPARPHPRGGTRPSAAPPPLHLSAGWVGVPQAVGQHASGEGCLHSAPLSRPRGRRPRPALALSLRGYIAHTAPGVYPGTQLPGGKGRCAGEQRACAHLRTPAVWLLPTRCQLRLAARVSPSARDLGLPRPLSRWRCSSWDG